MCRRKQLKARAGKNGLYPIHAALTSGIALLGLTFVFGACSAVSQKPSEPIEEAPPVAQGFTSAQYELRPLPGGIDLTEADCDLLLAYGTYLPYCFPVQAMLQPPTLNLPALGSQVRRPR